MSGIIPGGRQRASSEGDILDEYEEENETNTGSGLSSSHHYRLSKSLQFDLTSGTETESVEENSPIDTCSEVSSTTQGRRRKRRKPSFKAVKNFVSRLMTRPSSSTKKEILLENQPTESVKCNSSFKKWTDSAMKLEKTSQRDDSLDSSSRPLITNDTAASYPHWDKTPGCIGIENHGNTCFMNAVLQCLSNTDSFTEYFVTDLYKGVLKSHKGNSKKLSTQAELTEKLAVLLKSLWFSDYNVDASSDFKSVVGKYNQQYKGSDQHDAQEFLLWLLDHVHENLNTTATEKRKSHKDSVYKTDEDQATEVLLSNSGSFVYELFQALYRSSLTCPDCKKHSNTFDPYLCLSLPLPLKSLRPVYVTIVYLRGNPKQVKVGLQLNTYDTVRDLRIQLATNSKIAEERLVLCQIYDDGFRATYSDNQPLSDIHESETVYAVEMLPASSPDQEQPQFNMCVSYIQIILVHVEILSNPSKCYRFCSPHVIRVSRDITCKQLQHEILKGLGSSVQDGVLSQSQKMSVVFRLRIISALSGKSYLPTDVEMPLYTQTVDQVLSSYDKELGPLHLQLVAEWECNKKNQIIVDDEDDILEHSSVHQARLTQQHSSPVHLDECFQLFTQEEKLNGEDAWKCPHCNRERQGTTKTLGIWSLPEILVIHLKRFKQVGLRRNKLNTLVRFPVLDYNMEQHLVKSSSKSNKGQQKKDVNKPKKDEVTYDLIAVCNHYGNMHGGHYTAFCKNPADGCWYKFDDSKVESIEPEDIVTKSAYLLFYQRKTLTKSCLRMLQNQTHWAYSLPVKRSNVLSPKGRRARQSPNPSRRIPKSPLMHDGTSHSNSGRVPTKPQRTERYSTNVNSHKDLSGACNGLPRESSGIHLEQLRVSLPPAGAGKKTKACSPDKSSPTTPSPVSDKVDESSKAHGIISREDHRASNISTSSTSQTRPLSSSWQNGTQHANNRSFDNEMVNDPSIQGSLEDNRIPRQGHRDSYSSRTNNIPVSDCHPSHISNGRSTHQVIQSRPIPETINLPPVHKYTEMKESNNEMRSPQGNTNSSVGFNANNSHKLPAVTMDTDGAYIPHGRNSQEVTGTLNRTKHITDNRNSRYERSDHDETSHFSRNQEKRNSRVGRSSSSSRVDSRHHVKETEDSIVPPRPVTHMDHKVYSDTSYIDLLDLKSHLPSTQHSRSHARENINRADVHNDSRTSIHFDGSHGRDHFYDVHHTRANISEHSFRVKMEPVESNEYYRTQRSKLHDTVDSAVVQSRPNSSFEDRSFSSIPRRNLNDEFEKYSTHSRGSQSNNYSYINEDHSNINIPKSKTDYSLNSSGSRTMPATPVLFRQSDDTSMNSSDCYSRYQPQIHIPKYISKSQMTNQVTPRHSGSDTCLKESSV